MEINFYLIRHAECEKNLEDVVGGRSNDSPLTEKGNFQARLLKERLKQEKIDISGILCSPALRCLKTMQLALPNVSLSKVQFFYELQELDQGKWTGKPRKEIYTVETLEKINKNPWIFKPPQGESQEQVSHRIRKKLEEVGGTYNKNGNFLVFTHGGSIKYHLAGVDYLNKYTCWRIPIDHTSIIHLNYTPKNIWEVIKINNKCPEL